MIYYLRCICSIVAHCLSVYMGTSLTGQNVYTDLIEDVEIGDLIELKENTETE